MTDRVRAWRLLVSAAWRADRRRAVLVLVLAAGVGASSAGYGLAIKWLVDAAVRQSPLPLLPASAMAVVVVVGHLLGITAARMRIAMQQQVGLTVDQHLVELCAALPDLSHHEHPEYLDRMELLRQHRATIGDAYGALVENVRHLTRLVAVAAVIASLDGWLLLLPVFALPAVWAAGVGQHIQRRTEEDNAAPRRKRRRLLLIGNTAAAAAELRCYRLGQEIIRRHDDLLRQIHRRDARAEIRITLLSLAGWTVFAVALLGAAALILIHIGQGSAGPGDLALLLTVAGQLESALALVVTSISWLLRADRAATHYIWLIDHSRRRRRREESEALIPVVGSDLVLDRVSFRYPGTTVTVLDDVSLRLPAGTTVALVGENGAGKTTMVKLLCGLYEPSSGHLRYDGTDIGKFTRWPVAAGFQDFCRFELHATDTIGVGDLSRIDQPEAILNAVHVAGAAEVIDSLPNGLRSQLGRTFENGVELSTGQWQRLALARAAMLQRPVLRVLDEPTASLDPDAEHAVFTEFARQAGGDSAITIFVSHRFSTVRMADLIIVLDKGRITEMGSHYELIATDGSYAELFRLHAAGYGLDV